MHLMLPAVLIFCAVIWLFAGTITPKIPEGFDQLWHRADSLKDAGQPQASMKVVSQIVSAARLSGNQPQLVKGLLYGESLRSSFDEDYLVKSIAELEKALPGLKAPARQIISSALGDLYMGYYSANQYELLQRTKTESSGEDIATWDAVQVLAKADDYFRASLGDASLLKTITSETYDLVLLRDSLPGDPLPTLFDVLNHRVIEYYMEGRNNLKAGEPFRFRDPEWLAPAKEFLKIAFADTVSPAGYLVSRFRDAIAFHYRDKDPSALIDADLLRMSYVYENLDLPGRDTLYLHALDALESRYRNFEGATRVTYAIASLYQRMAINLAGTQKEEANRLFAKANDKAGQAISLFPKSKGAQDCRRLRDDILRPSLMLSVSEAVLPDESFDLDIHTRNVDSLWFRLIPLSRADLLRLQETRNDDLIESMSKHAPQKEWVEKTGNTFPYLELRQKLVAGPLSGGAYLLVAAQDNKFNAEGKVLATVVVQVTRLAWIKPPSTDLASRLVVVDRLTGLPVNGAKVTLRISAYNKDFREYRLTKVNEGTSDKNGMIVISRSKENNNGYFLELSNGSDFYVPMQTVWLSQYQTPEPGPRQQTWILTDRAIYRPGQQVWFKAILMRGIAGSFKTEAKQPVVVSLYDANNQQINKIDLVTDSYGSASGSFVLPSTGLAGNYRITTSSGSSSFKVESYKRPEFAVTLRQPEEVYQPGEEVTVKGKAEAYSGYSVVGARVSYTIMRSELSWWWPYRGPRSQEVVATGETVSSSDGTFAVGFKTAAITENNGTAPKDFSYSVEVTVTDQAGESHSSALSVPVSSKSMFITAQVDASINLSKMKPFVIRTVSAAEQPVGSSLDLSLYSLVQPDTAYWPPDAEDRPWRVETKPDRFALWPTGDLLTVQKIRYPSDSLADLKKYITKPGVYALKIGATDEKGHSARETFYFTVYDPASAKLPLRAPDWVVQLDNEVKPGESAQFLFGSSEKDARYLVQVCNSKGITAEQWIDPGRKQQVYSIPAAEKDEDMVRVHFVMVRNNRFFNHSFFVKVTEPEKEMTTKLITFRDHTEPGAREHWKVLVADGNGKPLDAEVLATMYDASLDAFASHSLNISTGRFPWIGDNWSSGAFISQNARVDYSDTVKYVDIPQPGYADLNWFGYQFFSFFNQRYMGGGKALRMMKPEAASIVAEDKEVECEPVFCIGDNQIARQAYGEQTSEPQLSPVPFITLRSNLSETAFFYPFLKTDSSGKADIEFVMPDALTRWKFMALAHTRDGLAGSVSQLITSSRDVMVVPALPRFVRKGDSLSLPVRVINLTDKPLTATVRISLLDDVTRKAVPGAGDLHPVILEIPAGGNVVAEWPFTVICEPGLIRYEAYAEAANQSDGQAGILPVLTDQVLVTNTKAFTLKGKEIFTPDFKQLIGNQSLKAGDRVKLTVEYASNPAWYVVQALPALKTPREYCVTDVLFRYYAAVMGRLVVDSYPEIKRTIGQWQEGSDAGVSPLTMNDDLKITNLDNTPWVMAASDETDNQRHLVDFYNSNNLDQFQKEAVTLLKGFQCSDGSFSWCKGMPGSRFLTGQVVETIGRLVRMRALKPGENQAVDQMVTKAIGYLDNELLDDYQRMLKTAGSNKPAPDASQLHYLYVRSYFFNSHPVAEKYREAFRFYQEGIAVKGAASSPMLQAMTALALHRAGDSRAGKMMASLADKALADAEGNMYWRREYGERWYDAPLETQAVIMEAWNELRPGSADLDRMKGWLLSRKRTEAWENQPATAGACYAFLLYGDRKPANVNKVVIRLNGEPVDQSGSLPLTGYFRKDIVLDASEAEKAGLSFEGQGDGAGWGGIYVQYYAGQKQVNASSSGISLNREVLKMEGDKGLPLVAGQRLTKGDRLRIRAIIKSERDMEFVTLRDLRAAGLEPLDVVSGYEWRDGAGYYQVTGDYSTDFYFYQLRKGTYIIEYDVNVTRNGNFTDGPATIQCQYAPAFSGRSSGSLLKL